MEGIQVEAVYENGTLKLPGKLSLAEGEKVTVTIHPNGGAVQQLARMMRWKGSVEDLEYLAESEENHPWAAKE